MRKSEAFIHGLKASFSVVQGIVLKQFIPDSHVKIVNDWSKSDDNDLDGTPPALDGVLTQHYIRAVIAINRNIQKGYDQSVGHTMMGVFAGVGAMAVSFSIAVTGIYNSLTKEESVASQNIAPAVTSASAPQ